MTFSSVTAYCPGHLSGYFKRVQGRTPATTGSTGAGIVISEGVRATVTPADALTIRVLQEDYGGSMKEKACSSGPLEDILKRLGFIVSVVTECRLPIGAGFGLSAAALLATLTAANRLCDGGLTPHAIAGYAHETEVIHRTGLGDVAACQDGGRVERTGPGIDAEIHRRFDLSEPLYAISFGAIPSPSVLGSPEDLERIAAAFPPEPSHGIRDFFSNANLFADRSGLVTPEVREVLAACRQEKVPAAMTMLGNGVFGYGREARDILMPFGTVYEFHMARHGTRIIGECS